MPNINYIVAIFISDSCEFILILFTVIEMVVHSEEYYFLGMSFLVLSGTLPPFVFILITNKHLVYHISCEQFALDFIYDHGICHFVCTKINMANDAHTHIQINTKNRKYSNKFILNVWKD